MKSDVRILHIISGDLWAGAEVQSYTLISQLHRLRGLVVAAVVMNPGTLSEKLRALGIYVEVVDEAQLSAARIVFRLLKVIKQWEPDVIHTHRDKESVLGLIANRLNGNVPSVRTVHGREEHPLSFRRGGFRRWLVSRMDQIVRRLSGQTIIAVSAAIERELRRHSSDERIVVIENGVDIRGLRAQLSASASQPVRTDATHIGIVGRLVLVKRVDLFLEMALRLLRDEPRRAWMFDVFGEGPERERLAALCDRLGIASHVTFHGHRQDIAQCIARLDVLVMCSDHEGMPMVALEAAALGVPTVAHAVGGLIDAVPKEFQVTRHDSRGYFEAVLRALHADARAATAEHAQRVLERFSAERNGERTLALYRELLSSRTTG